MSRTRKYNDKYRKEEPKSGRGRHRRLSARGIRRDNPDLRRMGKALVAFTLAEAETEAEKRRGTRRAEQPQRDETGDEDCA